jgi:hypothetical protein
VSAAPHGGAPEGAGHEVTDVRVRPVAIALAALGVLIAVSGGLGLLMIRHYTVREAARSAPASAIPGRDVAPEPRLQVRPADDLETLQAAEDALLHGYAWVDRPNGIVRIPIDEAMRRLAERRR